MLSDVDPDIARLIEFETSRQSDKLQMIPSESICPAPVLEALATPFSNKYAEGYPSTRMSRRERDRLPDFDRFLAFHRRYGDRRFYKGTEFADFVESIAQKRCAEVFGDPNAFVNVQPLSGGPANNAVFEAFLSPGDRVMGMHLSYGGHLSHGSPFNRSGKYYKVEAYTTGDDGRLDIDALRAAAKKHKPKLLIAGASAYPWTIDWAPFREIADEIGAYLLADISHPAGLVAAGHFPNPVGIAHVTMFTTHKTMLGPRGAVLISTDRDIARKIDSAVFPGEQGGPHVNNMAAKAVAFKLAQTDEFRKTQKLIVDDMKAFSEELAACGFHLAFGGTNTHLCLIDLRELSELTADIATNVLDLCGITCNKNALPGDATGVRPSGVRFGSVCLAQRGFQPAQMKSIARMVHKVITNITPFKVRAGVGRIVRGKIDYGLIKEVRAEVAGLTGAQVVESEAFEVSGKRARIFMEQAGSADLISLEPGQSRRSAFHDADGKQLEEAVVTRTDSGYHVEGSTDLREWLTAVSDGYVWVDKKDVYTKVHGPVAVLPAASRTAEADKAVTEPTKIFYIGQGNQPVPASQTDRTIFEFKEVEREKLRKTALTKWHKAAGARMLPFAGHSMPGWYGPVTTEHEAVRKAAGLFDVSHMGTLEISGPLCAEFIDSLTTNFVIRLEPGQSQYNYILDVHGEVMDDVIVYRMAQDRFMMVVNASNQEKIWQWIVGVNERRFIIDKNAPEKVAPGPVKLRQLKHKDCGAERRIDLAFQGPASKTVLKRLLDEKDHKPLEELDKFEHFECVMKEMPICISRTGYTGANVGYELFVHPENAVRLWEMLLETGKDLGVMATGLGARDSTRAEAGFPLYGHELSGEFHIIPSEAGYGAFVKRHKPFFVGKAPLIEREEAQKHAVARFRMKNHGIKVIRAGDPVIGDKGTKIGTVTSAVLVGGEQIGLAYVRRKYRKQGREFKVALLPRKGGAEYDESLPHEPAEVISRFQNFD